MPPGNADDKSLRDAQGNRLVLGAAPETPSGFKRVRLTFTLTPAQFARIAAAAATPLTYTVFKFGIRNNQQHALNRAWAKVGHERDFDPQTIRPIDPSDKMRFTAERLVPIDKADPTQPKPRKRNIV